MAFLKKNRGKSLLCTHTISNFAPEKDNKDEKRPVMVKSERLYNIRYNKFKIKERNKVMLIDFATSFMLVMVVVSTVCGIASLMHSNLR